MKIQIIYQYFGTKNSGWSTRIYDFAKDWVEKGHEVSVITSPYYKSDLTAKGFIAKRKIDGINVTIINTPDSNKVSTINRALNAIMFSIVSSIVSIFSKADVIICSSGPITVGVPLLLNYFLKKNKTIFEVRDLWPGGGIEMGKINNKIVQKIALGFEQLLYSKSTKIITASVGQMENIILRYPQSLMKISTISHSADLDFFSKSKDANDEFKFSKPFFVHIGSLGYIHNVKYIIESASELNKLGFNWPIILIGDGAEKKSLQKLCEELALTNIYFTGQLSKNELLPYLKHCTATLFCTLNNPIQNTSAPNKLFESFAAGKPVIQTTSGWIYDLFVKEACGLNCDIEDPKSMAKSMVIYVQNEQILQLHSKNAYNLASTQFNKNKLAADYLDVLINL